MRLPTPKELPEYYEMIKNPVDFNKIKVRRRFFSLWKCFQLDMFQKRLSEYRYRTIDELEADVMLLCKNAQEFNMENSSVRLNERENTIVEINSFYLDL